jgi:8-oxo-dGTP diphosphatase
MKQYASFQKYLENEYQGPFMATDIIIEYEQNGLEGIILIERKFPPYGVALPGGIAEKMTFAENAAKEAMEETGLTVIINEPYKPLCVLSNPSQDPRAFIASVAYVGRGYGKINPSKEEDAKRAFFVPLINLPEILEKNIWAFGHHKKILELYLDSKGVCYER